MIKTNNIVNSKQIIYIFNILRSLGLNTSHRGTKYINKAVQIIINKNSDIININNVYKTIANIYGNITPEQVKNNITYSLNSRNEQKSIENFEQIFGFEYNNYCFTNKNIVEEIARIIKYSIVKH